MRTVRRFVRALISALFAIGVTIMLFAILRGRPQDLPWTPLDLGAPIGLATGPKLAALMQDFGQCRALLDRAGVRYTVLAPRHEGSCGYDDAIRFASGGARRIDFSPASLGLACPVAAALAMWEWDVVQPAALQHFGQGVATIDHFGSYNCRRIRGRNAGNWSEHASANAVDVAGLRLEDGTRITIARNWKRKGKDAAFLHDVRDGACRLFSTTLSPDYNAAHADHLHLDQAGRGIAGWRACR